MTAVEIREINPPPSIQEAMTRQMSAERTRRADITESEGQQDAAINVADGEKRSAILRAEGDRESVILRTEGRRQAQILEAEGFAQAMNKINAAAQGAHANMMGLQYLDMMRTLGESPSTKWIIPMELANVARSIGDRLLAMTGAQPSGARARTTRRTDSASDRCPRGPLAARWARGCYVPHMPIDLHDPEGDARPLAQERPPRGALASCACTACECPELTGLAVCPPCQEGRHAAALTSPTATA